jgi:hypothetical protein
MLPNLTYCQYFILVSIFWIVLLILWLRILVWDRKLQKINAQLNTQLCQAQEKIQQLQSNDSLNPDIPYQPSSVCSKTHDNKESHTGSST